MGHSRPLLIYFRLFNTVDSKQVKNVNTNFANDRIQTADLWFQKRPLYQLSHNHFPTCFSFCLEICWNMNKRIVIIWFELTSHRLKYYHKLISKIISNLTTLNVVLHLLSSLHNNCVPISVLMLKRKTFSFIIGKMVQLTSFKLYW